MGRGVTWFLILIPFAVVACAASGGSDGRDRAAAPEGSQLVDGAVRDLERAIANAEPGETIRIPDGTYPPLTIQGKRSVRVEGSRGAQLGGLVIANSSEVTVTGLTIAPLASERAKVTVGQQASKITLDNLLLDGRNERAGVGFETDGTASDVTLRNSEITNCGFGTRCIEPNIRNFVLLRNRFHDCFDCDFIRGQSLGITIRGNSFDRAVPGDCTGGALSCPHNDHLQMLGGGPWTVVGNRFGERRVGAASVFINPTRGNKGNAIHDVVVASNIFEGEAGHYAIHVGDNKGGDLSLLQNIRIVNNTILSGDSAGVRVNDGWAAADPATKPVVANNIIRKMRESLCTNARTSRNLVEEGSPCPGDATGPARLDSAANPVSTSTLVLNKADPVFAPPTDYFGRYRNGLPDIGAVEKDGLSSPLAPVKLGAPTGVSFSLKTLKTRRWQISVRVTLSEATVLRARLLRANKLVASKSLPVAGKKSATLTLIVPIASRKPGRLMLALSATAPDGRLAARSVAVFLKP